MAFEIEVKKNAFQSATLYLDENVLRFGDKEIQIRSISGFGYMTTQTKVNGINASKTYQIKIWQHGEEKPTMINFMGAFGGGAANEKYHTITDQLWNYFGDNMLNMLHQDLMKGETIDFNKWTKLTSKGIVVYRKPLFGKPYEVIAPWDDLKVDTFQGTITFKSISNKKARTGGQLLDKNLWLLYFYIDWLDRNPQIRSQLMDVPNSYRLLEKVK